MYNKSVPVARQSAAVCQSGFNVSLQADISLLRRSKAELWLSQHTTLTEQTTSAAKQWDGPPELMGGYCRCSSTWQDDNAKEKHVSMYGKACFINDEKI